jgi:hypothetical protein
MGLHKFVKQGMQVNIFELHEQTIYVHKVTGDVWLALQYSAVNSYLNLKNGAVVQV